MLPAKVQSNVSRLILPVRQMLPAGDSLCSADGGGRRGGEQRWPKAWSIADYHNAYKSGRTDPLTMARTLVENVAASERQQPPMRMLYAHDPSDVLRQAQRSANRCARASMSARTWST